MRRYLDLVPPANCYNARILGEIEHSVDSSYVHSKDRYDSAAAGTLGSRTMSLLPKEVAHKPFGRSAAIARNRASTKSGADEKDGQVRHSGMEEE